jgi:hypothetical protein
MSLHNLNIEMLVQQSAERRMIRVALTDIENSPGHQMLLDTLTAGDNAQPRDTMADKLNPKKLVDDFVAAGAAVVVYPFPERPRVKAGPFGVEYHQWRPGALRWFELGGSEGRHLHSTKYTRAEAPHDLGVMLYDGSRRVAYVCPLEESTFDDDRLTQLGLLVKRRNEAMADPDTMERFLHFFEHG